MSPKSVGIMGFPLLSHYLKIKEIWVLNIIVFVWRLK